VLEVIAICLCIFAVAGLCLRIGYTFGRYAVPPLTDPSKLADGSYTSLGAVPLGQAGSGAAMTYLVVLWQHGTNARLVVQLGHVPEPFTVTGGIVRPRVVVDLPRRVDKHA
jgi:hypothetical protein